MRGGAGVNTWVERIPLQRAAARLCTCTVASKQDALRVLRGLCGPTVTEVEPWVITLAERCIQAGCAMNVDAYDITYGLRALRENAYRRGR